MDKEIRINKEIDREIERLKKLKLINHNHIYDEKLKDEIRKDMSSNEYSILTFKTFTCKICGITNKELIKTQ